MKRIVTLFLIVLMMLAIALFAVSCGETEKEQSAVEKLSSNEKLVYDIITGELSSFKDPGSVTITSIYQHTDSSVMVNISAKNSLGGTTSDEYLIFTKDAFLPSGTQIAKSGHMESFDDMNTRLGKTLKAKDFSDLYQFMIKTTPTTNISYDVGLLNEAINEYKDQRGW